MRLKQLSEIILNIFVLAAVAFLLYVNIAHYIYGQVVLAVVKGRSMYPLFSDNDMVIVLPSKDIGLGDIVVYRNGRGEYVIHRVIAIASCKEGYTVYITKGDYNPYIDTGFSSLIAFGIDRRCTINKIDVLKGYERYVMREIVNGNVIKGIPEEVIMGKIPSFFGIAMKISGLTRIGA